jgi:hypothetical protein
MGKKDYTIQAKPTRGLIVTNGNYITQLTKSSGKPHKNVIIYK